MRRVFFAWFSPLFFREQQSSVLIDEAIQLCSSLLVDVKKAEFSIAEDSLSLQWCSKATTFVKKIHSEFLLIVFEKSNKPIFWDAVNCLDEYMNESLHLLDLCNLLKSAISALDGYRLMAEFTVKRFSDEGFSSSAMYVAEIEKLETQYMKIYGIENWKDDANLYKTGRSKTGRKDSSLSVAYVMKRTMKMICVLLFSATFYPVQIETDDEEIYREFPQLETLSFSAKKLVCCLSVGQRGGEDNNSRPVLVEPKMMEKAIVDIKAQIRKGVALDKQKLGQNIDSLKNSCLAFKEGIKTFDSVVTELFEEVVRGRNKLLGMVAAF